MEFPSFPNRITSGLLSRYRGFLTIFVTLTFTPIMAQAATPSHAKVCFAALAGINALDPARLLPSRYTLRSLENFRQEKVGVPQATPLVARGSTFQFPGERNAAGSFTRIGFAGHLEGIKRFASSVEGSSSDKAQVIKAKTIVGQADIEEFLGDLQRFATQQGEKEKNVKDAANSLYPFIFGVGGALMGILHHLGSDTTGLGMAEMCGLTYFIAGAAQSIGRNFMGRNSVFTKRIDSLKKILSAPGGWGFISENTMVLKDPLELIDSSGGYEGVIDEALAKQNLISTSPALFYKPVWVMSDSATRAKMIADRKKEWLAADLLLDNRDGNPKLHIVVRYSQDRPIFPQTESEEDKTEITHGGQLRPIPIRIPPRE